ncbi:alpha-glucosidase AglA [Treponema sp.]
MQQKLALIGAGSATFSLNLIKDLCLTDSLENMQIVLMDVDVARLNAAYALCTRYALEAGAKLLIKKTKSRKDALKNANFVIDTALPGGLGKLREGWDIAFRHGYRFGGSFHVVHDEAFWINYHQLSLMEEIVQDMERYCPDAYLVMVANPVLAGITYLSRKYRGIKLVGMCHGFGGVYSLARTLGLEREHITFSSPGVNHFVWLSDFRYKGEDAYPILDKWLATKAEEHWAKCGVSDHEGRKPCDIYKRYGLFPIGDTATPGGGAWPWQYHVDDQVEKSWGEDPKTWYQNYFDSGLESVKKIAEAVSDKSHPVRSHFPSETSDEPMVPLIEALACDKERIVIVNIPNEGSLVPGVPENFEVEVPALISGRGIQGIQTKRLPQPILSRLLRDRVAPVEIELEAYDRGDRKLLHELVMLDPWTRSDKQATGLIEEILALPHNASMAAHYKR